MKPPIEYTVMGEDGKEYGPVFADQIRAWIQEGRLGAKTPIKAAADKDWIFLSQVPEFAEFFAPKVLPPKIGTRRGFVRAFLVVAVITALYFLFVYLNKK